MGGGGKGGKGGGGAIDVDVTSNSSSVMDSDATITSTSNNQLTTTSNTQLDSNATAQLQVVGLDNIRLRADTASDSRTQLEMDLKPLQVDLCLKVGLERLPSTRVCRPTTRRFAITLFNVEVIGFNYASERNTFIEDMRNRPFVLGGLPQGGSAAGGGHERDGVRIRLAD